MKTAEIRKQLHHEPELSGDESKTSAFIRDQLEKLGIKEIYHSFSQHSLIAVIEGENPGKTILFRCELDALPIEESNDFNYRSSVDGISHKCGHDGHMAILLSLAEKLINTPPKNGQFLLLFQSAEETGEGARAVLNSGIFEEFTIDHVIALHNVPGYPLGSIVCKEGAFTPSVESFTVHLKGKTSHAGEPDKGKNPAVCIAQIINFMKSFHEPDQTSAQYFVVAPIHIEMGEKAFGTSAGEAEIGYTIRANDFDEFNKTKQSIVGKIHELAKEDDLVSSIEWLEPFAANENNPEVVNQIKIAAKKLEFEYIDKEFPFDWGEDFGLFTQNYKGAMFGLGAGENTPSLHDANYDFPDELIEKGEKMFYELANELSQ